MKLSLVSIPVQDPVTAHAIYTEKLGFQSKQFDADASLAIVVANDSPDGTAMLLEPCQGNFVETYQKLAYEARLPIMIFSSDDVEVELDRLKEAGVTLRPDLDRPEWGLTNLFEDGCGNLLMLEQSSS